MTPPAAAVFEQMRTDVVRIVGESFDAGAQAGKVATLEQCLREVARLKKPLGIGYNRGIADALEVIRALGADV